ncbi:FkbM family methyltransferase [Thiovibrio sp. JS02]
MLRNVSRMLCATIRKAGNGLLEFARWLHGKATRSTLIRKGKERSLYRTASGDYFWLNTTGYVDRCIREAGIFEPLSTRVVRQLVKPGDVVLDVGANIGYYTVLLSKLVGGQGKVICFEPTKHYGSVLEKNIQANGLRNIELLRVGLSDKQQEMDIQIGEHSATLHVPGNKKLNFSEKIQLIPLDAYLGSHPLPRLDFIKIDVDGHEPLFLEGAKEALQRHEPIILLEISHMHYLNAGYNAWDFYKLLKNQGYYIYHEQGLVELRNLEEFLVKCGNFAYSANIVLSKRRLEFASEDGA